MRWHHAAHGVQLYGASITPDGQVVESDEADSTSTAFNADEQRARAHSTFFRLALPAYTIHFKSPSYLQPQSLDLLDKRVVKETLRLCATDEWVRTGIGSDARVWHELVLLLKAAVPSVERRSFHPSEPSAAPSLPTPTTASLPSAATATATAGAAVDYDATSGALIAAHYPGLWRDVERVNDVVSIARNVLTIGVEAQDMASAYGLDLELFRLVNCCVRVTARGYDGPAGTGEEEKWQWVVNGYKKLLITCLQLLNNLAAQNERKKCMLWQSLFDHASDAGFREEHVVARTIAPPKKPVPPITSSDILLAYGSNGPHQRLSPLEFDAAQLIFPHEGFKSLPANAVAARKHAEPNGYVYFTARHKALLARDFHAQHKRQPTLAEMHRNIPHYWHASLARNSRLWSEWQGLFEKALDAYRDDDEDYADYLRDPDGWQERFLEGRAPPPPLREISMTTRFSVERHEEYVVPSYDLPHIQERIEELQHDMAIEVQDHAERERLDPSSQQSGTADPMDPRNIQDRFDEAMPFTADAGSKILESGKGELMRRLEGWVDVGDAVARTNAEVRREQEKAERRASSTGGITSNSSRRSRSDNRAVEDAFAEESLDEDEEDDDDDDEEEEDYPGSTEDGRGLLTDVPLILGPSEIEVLPMLIMSGLVAPPLKEGQRNQVREELEGQGAKFRCHLLLFSTSGRNLLRELLIFVAAWDLREEELYFKFMVRILEAILHFGLMPYAYHAFRDRSRSKDIISPAQAVIMKLLTCIFRGRNDLVRRNIRGETIEGQLPTVGDREARGIISPEPFSGTLVEEAEWLRQQHEKCVSWKQRLGLLPSAVDLRFLNFIFTEFRQHIIPQTCALIFLQGQIHQKRAKPDDFPLNLWDIERIYEGVYQSLEMIAALMEDGEKNLGKEALEARNAQLEAVHGPEILAEYVAGNGVFMGDETVPVELNGKRIWEVDDCGMGGLTKGWKELLARWEMASELVTLLRELEGGIPKVSGSFAPTNAVTSLPPIDASSSFPTAMPTTGVATKPKAGRSMSADDVLATGKAGQLHQLPASLTPGSLPPLQPHSIFEGETPLAYPEDQINVNPAPLLPPLAPGPLTAHQDLQASPSHDQDEPSNFEWRNLKKLTILVLSSLVFKQQLVKDQIRQLGALETLVECCRPDENNPCIRDHAIMCLRFAVEGCPKNATVLVKLANAKKQAEADLRRSELQQDRLALTPSRSGDALPTPDPDQEGFDAFFDNRGRTCLRRKRDNAVVAVEGEIDPDVTVKSLLTAPAVPWDGQQWDGRPETMLNRFKMEAKGLLPRAEDAGPLTKEEREMLEEEAREDTETEEVFCETLVRTLVGNDT